MAALEQAAGARLFDRHPGGVRLTAEGRALLRHAVVALDALDAADRELRVGEAEDGPVRLGFFPTAGAVIVSRALAALRREHPRIRVSTREGTTPSLVRALRTGTLDIALLSSRPPHRSPDTDAPPLRAEPLFETRLAVAVATSGRFAGRDSVTAEEIAGEPWIASPAVAEEPLLGVWPGLPGRPRVRHTVRDWLTKLHSGGRGGHHHGPTGAASRRPARCASGRRRGRGGGVAPRQPRVRAEPPTASANAVVHALRQEAVELADDPTDGLGRRPGRQPQLAASAAPLADNPS